MNRPKESLQMLQNYLEAVQKEMSYVGGNGAIEDDLWSTIKQLQKQMRKAKVEFPEYETIDCNQEDWV